MYTIQNIVLDAYTKNNCTIYQLSRDLEFSVVSKCMRQLNVLLYGKSHEFRNLFKKHWQFISRVAEVLNISEEINAAKLKTPAEFWKYDLYVEEMTFTPFIYIKTESQRPASITVAAFCGGSMKFIRLQPSVATYDLDIQIRDVRLNIENYLTKFEGQCPLFGKVTGFYYRPKFEKTIEFDLEGKIINDNLGYISLYPTPSNGGSIELKGRELPHFNFDNTKI